MKNLLACFLLLLSSFAAATDFVFQNITLVELSRLVFSDVLKQSYTLDNDSLNADIKVSVDWKNVDDQTLMVMYKSLLEDHGYTLKNAYGVNYISKINSEHAQKLIVYRPKYKDVKTLQIALSKVLKLSIGTNQNLSNTVSQDSGSPTSGTALMQGLLTDVLTIEVPTNRYEVALDLIRAIDTPIRQVDFKAIVYEYSTTKKEGLGFGLTFAKSILGAAIGLSIPAPALASNILTIKGFNIDAIAEILNSKDDFKLVSSPSVRVSNLENAVLNVGAQVPVLNSTTTNTVGQVIQSVEYRPSGVTLDVKPRITDEIIQIDLTQTISNFTQTTTGVNSSPTLLNRSIKTSLISKAGEVIMIGGLQQNRNDSGRSDLPFGIPTKRTSQDSVSEIIVFIEVQPVNI